VKEDEEGTTVVKVDSGEDDEDIEDETNAWLIFNFKLY
jgi:hypothetical protein